MYRSSSGVVLISVLLIFAATTVIVASLQLKFMQTVKYQGLVLADAQIQEYVKGAELLASLQLQQDVFNDLQKNESSDHISEPWAQLQVYPIKSGGEIRTQLVDLQGRLNIATLPSDPKVQQVFVRLLEQLQIPSDDRLSATDILTIVMDWVDPDQEQRGFIEAEDDYYLSLQGQSRNDQFGYRTSQLPLGHLSELLLLRGMTKKEYSVLSRYLTLLPRDASININTVAFPLAQALNVSGGGELVTTRPEEGFTQTDMASLSASQRPEINYNVDSRYYELRTQVVLGDVKSHMTSILFVPTPTNPQEIKQPLVFQRDLGWSYYYSL